MILRRLADAIREQNWLTVVLEVLIVVVGILIGLHRITSYNVCYTKLLRTVSNTSSIEISPSSTNRPKYCLRGSIARTPTFPRKHFEAISNDAEPEMRSTAMAPSPKGVEIAAIVSCTMPQVHTGLSTAFNSCKKRLFCSGVPIETLIHFV